MKRIDRIKPSKTFLYTRENYVSHKQDDAHDIPLPESEMEIVKKHFQFIPSTTLKRKRGSGGVDGESKSKKEEWERRIAEKYQNQLFKEFALCKFHKGKVAMRWRTEKEVLKGKGEKICANLDCDTEKNLRILETVFSYFEHGEKKSALVKLCLCSSCQSSPALSSSTSSSHKKDEDEHEHDKMDKIGTDNNNDDDDDDDDDDHGELDKTEEWKEPRQDEEPKTKEEEFDDFFSKHLS